MQGDLSVFMFGEAIALPGEDLICHSITTRFHDQVTKGLKVYYMNEFEVMVLIAHQLNVSRIIIC